MFSRLTRSFKGSQDTLVSSGRGPVSTLQDLLGEYQEAECQSEAGQSRDGREGRKKRRSRKLSRLFGSDAEEERSSVVSDNPQLYSRSMSMAQLSPSTSKTGLLQGKDRRLNTVARRMEGIQKSLSVQGLSEGDAETVVRLRKELQRKEKAISVLKRQMEGVGKGGEELRSKVREVEEKVERRERYLKELREEGRRRVTSDRASIEGQITAAEREYEVERVQLELLDLGQELLSSRGLLERHHSSRGQSLTSLLGEAGLGPGQPALLVSAQLTAAQLDRLNVRQEGGLELGEGQAKDRVLELEGKDVTLLPAGSWPALRTALRNPADVLLLRRPGQGRAGGELREDIALIQSRLERKLVESRGVETELGAVRREREGLQGENTRLRHRVAFLEEHTRELQAGLKGVRDSLARTLDSGLATTLSQLDGLGEGGVLGGEVDRCSTSTSGVYSAGDSEGSSSPPGLRESTASRVGSRDARRWSLGLPEVPPPQASAGRRRTLQPQPPPPPKPARQHLNQSEMNPREAIRGDPREASRGDPREASRGLAKSSSRVGQLVRWPLRSSKDRSASSMAVDRAGSRDVLV